MRRFRFLTTCLLLFAVSVPACASSFPALMQQSKDGFIMVEFADQRAPEVTAVPVDTLPQADADAIRAGLVLPDQNSYTKAMEDFCS